MKKLFPVLLVFMVAFAGTMNAPRGESPDKITVEGKLIDSKCYGMNHANAGNDHAGADGSTMPSCGAACAKMGLPVAVLEGGKMDGKVYLVIGPASGYADYMAKDVKFEGEQAYAGAIIPSKLWVKEEGKWKEKPLPGTMM